MSRRARIALPNVPLHVIQRGNNRQACFFGDADYRTYLAWLEEYARETDCRVHAYVLMTNHVHLLISPARTEAPGDLMKALGQRYVQYVNRVHGRSGTLWEGRYRSCLIQSESYLLACQRYIELNPVRARMVAHPTDYPWSSHRMNVRPNESSLVSPHDCYLALGRTNDARQIAYRRLFDLDLAPDVLEHIRGATNGNFALGDRQFADKIAATLGRRVLPGRPGRPKALTKQGAENAETVV